MRHYDHCAVPCHFQVGDKVLTLLPIQQALRSQPNYPYDIHELLSATDYVVSMPERKRKACL